MKTSIHLKLYLLVNALLYFIFGIWCAVAPEWTAAAVGLSFPSAQGYAEYVAVYGGLEFGVGLFFLLCARTSSLATAGILFGTCFYVGLFCFRSLAILRTGLDIGNGVNFYLAEFLFMSWSLYLVLTKRDNN